MEEEDDNRGEHVQRYDNEFEFNEEEFEEEQDDKNFEDENQKFELIDNQYGGSTQVQNKGPKITPNFLTKYEKSRIIGTRAMQISKNAPVMIQFGKDDYDPIQIAEKELLENKIPYIIRRRLPDGSYEDCYNFSFKDYSFNRGCQ